MSLSIVEFIGGLADGLNWLRAGTAGWRYLFSPTYRHQTHRRWRTSGKLRIIGDVLGAVFGFLVSLLGLTSIIFGVVLLLT